MDHREKTILIWVLSCAGLLLLLLYSPWGSPDLYTKKIYFAENQGVNFASSGIKNAYKGDASSQNYGDAEITVPDYYAERNSQVHYTACAAASSSVATNRIIAVNRIGTAGSNLNNRVKSTYKTGGGTPGGGGSGSMGGSSHGSKGSNNSSPQISGVSDTFKTSTVDLSLFGDSTALLASNTSQKSDSLDPGDEDPLGEPVPMPEGWNFLILLAVAYGGYIYFKNKKTKQPVTVE